VGEVGEQPAAPATSRRQPAAGGGAGSR
jgi:hypothetical protein